jgi:hypothetical protein
MLKLKYLDSNKTYDVSFFVVTDNIVEIIGDFPIQTTGFTLSRSECDDNWDYSNYTTIYRKIDGGVQFSNDESIYEEPDISDIPENPDYIPEEPYKPTLQEIQENKIREMNVVQQQAIQNGITVTLTDGTNEHFTLSDKDQTSLMGLQAQIAAGVEQIPWHTSDQTQHCKYYSNADMALIVFAAMQYVTYHVTYYRDLRIYIRSLDSDSVGNVYYGMPIPAEYQSEPLKDMLAAQML